MAAASEVYFGKPLAELSLAEMATIAGLPKAPSTINPITSPERAINRRAYVLRRMLDAGYISQAQHDEAARAPMESQEHGPRVEIDAPFVAEMVRAELVSRFGEEAYSAGYKVTTTVDSRLQHTADWSLRATLLEYDRRHGYRGPVAHTEPGSPQADHALETRPIVGGLWPAIVTGVNARDIVVRVRSGQTLTVPWEGGLAWARPGDDKGGLGAAPKTPSDIVSAGDLIYVLPTGNGQAFLAQIPLVQGAFVSLDPQDGAILALVGGFDFYQSKFNRAAQAKRQPGSSFKPFIYSGALEKGFTPASVILDAPIVLDAQGSGESWRPSNDEKSFSGPTRMRDALARSRNLVSIRILRAIGIDYATNYATRFGFTEEELPHNLTLALGTPQLTPLQMATAYSVFLPDRPDRGRLRAGRVPRRARGRLPRLRERASGTAGAGVRRGGIRRRCGDAPWSFDRHHRTGRQASGSVGDQRGERVHHDRPHEGRYPPRHRAARAGAQARRHRRQDGHDQRSARYVVFRVQRRHRRHRLGRLRPGALAGRERRGRAHGAADVGLLHGRGDAWPG